jgi:hypothetical protein
VRDTVFQAAAISLPGITPVVFGDELFQTSLRRIGEELAPLAANFPLIFGHPAACFCLDSVLHREVSVIFPIYEAGGGGDCPSGHDLGNEDNPSAILAAIFAPNVESQVHLLELSMEGNWEIPEELGPAESKTYEADVCFPLE